MKLIKCFHKAFFRNAILSRVIVLILILSMVLLSACDGDDSNKKKPNNNETNSSSENNSSENIDYTKGEFSFEKTVENNKTVIEVIPKGNTANLSNPLKGYWDDEAEKLRGKILNSKNTEDIYKITGTKYYVSSLNGNDMNSGLSPEQAFETIEGIKGGLEPGDAVLFERGSVFRIFSAFLTESGVIYGSYGTGEKPKIYGSPENLVNAKWTPSKKKNVWKTDYVYSECAGMFFNHGKEVGYRRTSLKLLEQNTEFFQDTTSDTIYLYCDKGNPALVYESIEFSTQMNIIGIPSGVSNVTIDNLCLKYGGMIGISCTWNAKGVTISNCEIGYIGGGTTAGGSSRYGNAIQFWTGANDIVVKNNWIYQTWDTGISWQGYGGDKFKYTNISFEDNLLEYNNADFEFWDPKSTVHNFNIDRNIMRFTSMGWGTRKDDGGFRGIDGAFVATTASMNVKDLFVRDNIIDCPGRFIINWDVDPKQIGDVLHISGTRISVNSKYRTTTDIVLRGYITEEGQSTSVEAKDSNAFRDALKRFDTNAVLEWY